MEQLLRVIVSQRLELQDLLARQQRMLELTLSQMEDLRHKDLASLGLLSLSASNSPPDTSTSRSLDGLPVGLPSLPNTEGHQQLRNVTPTMQPAAVDESEADVPPDPSGSVRRKMKTSRQGSKQSKISWDAKAEAEVGPAPSTLVLDMPAILQDQNAPNGGDYGLGPTEDSYEHHQPGQRLETIQSPTLRGMFTQYSQPSVLAIKTDPEAEDSQWGEKTLLYVDRVSSFAVCINAIAMMVEFEFAGQANAFQVGFASESIEQTFSAAIPSFMMLRIFFDVFFLVEFLIRGAVLRSQVLKDSANLFDLALVLAGVMEMILIFVTPWTLTHEDRMLGLILRALGSLRAIRVLRVFRFCAGLQLLMKACQSFVTSLFWSMVLLGVCMLAGALVVGNLLQDYIRGSADLDDRQWVWQFYGTTYRSWYTLYEITFAGNWPTMARPVLDKVSHGFVVFYVLYITIVVFALIRVITAVFLKDTLDSAHNDAELRITEGMRKKAEYVEKLETIFKAIDESGDGMITEERLSFILENPKVKAYFQTLDLDVHESAALFRILDDGDGECTLDEFIGGILRCKGPARAIDQVALQADMKQLDKKVSKILKALCDAGWASHLSSVPGSEGMTPKTGSGEQMSCPVSKQPTGNGTASMPPASGLSSASFSGLSGYHNAIHYGGSEAPAGWQRQESGRKRRASQAAQMFLHRTALNRTKTGGIGASAMVSMDDINIGGGTYIL